MSNVSTSHVINSLTIRFAAATSLLVAAFLLPTGSAHAQAYVNVTVGGVIVPGVYGQVAIGNNPPPPIINPQPVIVGAPVYVGPPVYMYVPIEEQRDWPYYCARYRACGYPVHFVEVGPRDRWWARPNSHLRGHEHYWEDHHGRHEGYREERRERGYERGHDGHERR